MRCCKSYNASGPSISLSGVSHPSNSSTSYAPVTHCAWSISPRAGARDGFRQILSFATTIHDRVYLINEQFGIFNITLEGETQILALVDKGRGALLMGAHMGSFEVMHSLGRRRHGLKVAMAMYEENARKINAILAAINPHLESDIVSLGRIDDMLNIAEPLDHGAVVGVLRDRMLA